MKIVLLPYRFTLFSNSDFNRVDIPNVLLPYRFTLFSNKCNKLVNEEMFYYLIDLHYSQTGFIVVCTYNKFYYLIDLHYSQTG